ncbi:ABC transporter ATP-binding protein [Kutzneria sp. 744]|uniref:ABC transporter ATP-binding protein n=1 Tax=Kutzneria sp. (strain 744) TaxID=345341 RepID=UPI0003EED3CC|nr:dipeptide ABC transporter ATP-binding protein [Kutzneria sp. 744]EWM13979.1 peptide/nickel transporter ATP-binding protein [Kutzneria sp. 744]
MSTGTETRPASGDAGTTGTPLLQVKDLFKSFPVRGGGIIPRTVGQVQAVHGVSFDLAAGETLGLVGESGSGKSTTGRAILQLHKPTSGSVKFEGRELTTMHSKELQAMRRDLQIVFQDPYASLDPRWQVNDIIAEPLRIHRFGSAETIQQRINQLMEIVGLNPEHRNRYAHEFSGGQRQRIGIARALALNPKFVVLDEPVSALDVSVQAGVVNLLGELQQELNLAYLFVAHDLSVVRHLSHRVAVMYLGSLIEVGPREQIYSKPMHPYTQALLSAVPVPDPKRERERQRSRIVLTGDVPSPVNPPSGCRFRTRCWKAQDVCATEVPELKRRGDSELLSACHFAEEMHVA